LEADTKEGNQNAMRTLQTCTSRETDEMWLIMDG